MGVSSPTTVLDFERKVRTRRIDVFYEDMGILIENKSRGVDLNKEHERGKNEGGEKRFVTPFAQAKWYADNLPHSIRPRYILTCNFDEIRIYDLDVAPFGDEYESIMLEDLPDQLHRLNFFRAKENSRLQREKDLSIAAGSVVGRLYDLLSSLYKHLDTDEGEQRSLNVLIVRIVFLLYAEDAGLLATHQAFYEYLQEYSAPQMRDALSALFEVLRTPDGTGGTDDERDEYLADNLKSFPYINGGLFEEKITIPQFSPELRDCLLKEASSKFDWKDISPTIFGAIFESALNPETRRSGGMHYTSIENIHKVINPLFLDDLKNELISIENMTVLKNRTRSLRLFQEKLAGIKVLDPACGSGNFLTETYIQLRELENRVLGSLSAGVKGGSNPAFAISGGTDETTFDIKVSIDQFYGIEINDYAVEVAKTALWIAEQQMLEKTQEILFGQEFDFLPLKSNTNIVCGNALRMDWNEVIPASECDYIIGNPPFLGHQDMSKKQHDDLDIVLSDCKKHGKLDYVAGWYAQATNYIGSYNISCAFVSTNSICQGEQVGILWDYLFNKGVNIEFAYRTFVWNSEATDQAHVHCVIVGFDKG
ncbi:MAG: class I SAM-dependent DNA methyltransferase, partial [Actinomycetaceae bacterium]|nr:class I SAM-dependent DNA methyltransferase [Actinomycetaceae bacterium]